MKKLLFITDDIRLNSGVGIQARKLLKGLARTGKYKISTVGCALNHKNLDPIIEDNVTIYPINIKREYGDKNTIRFIINKENPDYVIPFGDPRFFGYLFSMDDEIRTRSKIVFYHTWDNDPFPKFNIPLYNSCDALVMISKFSYNLIKDNVEIPVYNIQHGFNPAEFFPIKQEEINKERENLKILTGLQKLDFVIFWNNRNISRKRPGDVMMIFKEFHKKHPNSILLMNTDYIDMEGIDILQFQRDLNFKGVPIIFNFNKVDSYKLNVFYNVADITFTITHSEGFGLCVGESLCSGTPVVANRTGGMVEQMSYITENGEEIQFGYLMKPDVRHLFGVPGASYIYQDYVSNETALSTLEIAYNNRQNLKELGRKGREYIIKNFHEDTVIQKWDTLLTDLSLIPSNYQRIKKLVI